MDKLEKCPRCGGNAVLGVSLKDQEAFARCSKCGEKITREIGLHKTGQTTRERIEEVLHETADEWNRRPANDQEGQHETT